MANITDKKKTARNTKKAPAANRNQQNAKKKQARIVPSADELKYKADDERITKQMKAAQKWAQQMNNSKKAKAHGRIKQAQIVPSADELKYKADDERITKRMETAAKLATRMNNSKAAKTAGRRTQSRIIPSPEELEKTSKKPKW